MSPLHQTDEITRSRVLRIDRHQRERRFQTLSVMVSCSCPSPSTLTGTKVPDVPSTASAATRLRATPTRGQGRSRQPQARSEDRPDRSRTPPSMRGRRNARRPFRRSRRRGRPRCRRRFRRRADQRALSASRYFSASQCPCPRNIARRSRCARRVSASGDWPLVSRRPRRLDRKLGSTHHPRPASLSPTSAPPSGCPAAAIGAPPADSRSERVLQPPPAPPRPSIFRASL